MSITAFIPFAALLLNLMVTLSGALWFVFRITNVTTRLSTMIEHLEKAMVRHDATMAKYDADRSMQAGRIEHLEQWRATIDERLRTRPA
jgi:hypothetical protein